MSSGARTLKVVSDQDFKTETLAHKTKNKTINLCNLFLTCKIDTIKAIRLSV